MVLDKKYEELLGQGEVYLGYGQLDKAEECFRKVLAVDETNWFALNKMGVIFGRKGQLTEALNFFDKAILNTTEKNSIYCNIGNVYLQQKDYDKAIEYYLMAVKDNPENYIPMKNLAVAYKKKGLIKDFIQCAKKARELENKHAKEKGYESNFSYLMSLVNKKEGIPLTFILMLLLSIILLIILILLK